MAVRLVTGFEHGTTAGWGTGNTGNKFADQINTSPTITTSNPRTGTYCLEVSASAAAESVLWDTNTLTASQTRLACGFGIYFPTSLPSGTVILAQMNVAVGVAWLLEFNSSTTKLAAGWEGGTITDGPTVTTNTWYYVELYANVSANPNTLDWAVDTVSQTQVTQAQAATTVSNFRLGTSNAETFTARYDDLIVDTSTSNITFPLGKHKIQGLQIDPAGTFTLTGTTGNFNTFTNNGTLAAWDATTARNNVDEVPVTVGASADGWVQITLATGDFVDMPLTTYTLAAGESVAGARAWFIGWATSTTAATFGVRAFNGTTEETLQAGTVDPNFDNSTTAPAWICKMLTLANYDTQGELDALSLRGGFSSDATPDIGLHGCGVELAIKESTGIPTAEPPLLALQAVKQSHW